MTEELTTNSETETLVNNVAETTAISESATDTSWLDGLPEEIRSSQSLSKFKDVSGLAQSYLEAEKSLSSRIALPDEKADNDIWSKFYQKLGMPEDKRYTDKRMPEDEHPDAEEYLKAYEEMFYDSGLSKRQGEKLLGSLYNYSNQIEQQTQEKNKSEMEKTKVSNIDWLKSSYGNDFDSRMGSMQAALKEFGSKELAQMLEDSLYAPALVDMLSKVGNTLKSDSLVTGNEKAPISNKDQALKEIKKLENDSDFVVKLSSKNHAGHKEAVSRMNELHNIAYS